MSQKELVMYLENLKNLEILKYRAVRQIKMCDAKIAEENEKLKEQSYRFDTSTIVSLIVSVVLLCAAVCLCCFADGSGFGRFLFKTMLPIMAVVFAIVIPLVTGAFSDFFQTLSRKGKAKKHNQHVQQITPQVKKEIEAIGHQKAEIQSDVVEIDNLLAEAYSFNLIPLQFRQLPYIIYIFDYVSTSQQSLENALLHSHIEQAVQQINAKLDVIIAQNMQIMSLLRANLAAARVNASQVASLSGDVRLNNHLVRVNNFYLRSKLL